MSELELDGPADERASEAVFRTARLCLGYFKNRDGTDRDEPHFMEAKNGRVSIPDKLSVDPQGKKAFVSVDRVNGQETAISFEKGSIALIDKTTDIRIRFDGECVTLFGGRVGDPSISLSFDGQKVFVVGGEEPKTAFEFDGETTTLVLTEGGEKKSYRFPQSS